MNALPVPSIHRKISGFKLPRLFLFIAAWVQASGTTWYLDKAAAGANDGTSARDAWVSVNAVDLKKLQSGDTLLIQGGDYSTEELKLLLPRSASNITFKIDPSATKKAVFKSIYLQGGNGSTVDGLLPGSEAKQYNPTIQMFRTVGLNTMRVHERVFPASSVMIRESTGATVRGIECDQSALVMGRDDGRMQQHGIAINGAVKNCVIEYCHIHDTIGDGINLIYNDVKGTSFDNIVVRYNYVYRVGDDCLQSGHGNVDIYGNFLDQAGAPVYYGGHPDAVQINPFSSYVKIHENVLVDALQQPFLEKVEGEIYCYNNIVLCLRSEAVPPKPPFQTGGATISSADGYQKQRGYLGPSFGNLIFAYNLIYNDTATPALKGYWPATEKNNVIFTGNVYINDRLGASFAAGESMFEKTSVWWDQAGVVWYDFQGRRTGTNRPRFFGTALNKDPGLIDPENLNFHPASANSTVVGLGRNLTEYGITTDFDGNPRPTSGSWTAGPYEWTGAAVKSGLRQVPTPPAK